MVTGARSALPGYPALPSQVQAAPGILGEMALDDLPVRTLQGDESSLGEYAGKTRGHH
jgi:hypothetical protein